MGHVGTMVYSPASDISLLRLSPLFLGWSSIEIGHMIARKIVLTAQPGCSMTSD